MNCPVELLPFVGMLSRRVSVVSRLKTFVLSVQIVPFWFAALPKLVFVSGWPAVDTSLVRGKSDHTLRKKRNPEPRTGWS